MAEVPHHSMFELAVLWQLPYILLHYGATRAASVTELLKTKLVYTP